MTSKAHLTEEKRETIEYGIRSNLSARRIARYIGCSASTVTREVKMNRTIKKIKSTKMRFSLSCAHYQDCDLVGKACEKCSTIYTSCRKCHTRNCTVNCQNFELAMCPTVQSWPYVCPENCHKRHGCNWPKCTYRKEEAQRAYEQRLSESREGINLTEEEFVKLDSTVSKLVRQGHSFEAIALSHALPVCTRTLYGYQEKELLSLTNAHLPRKVRCKPRKSSSSSSNEEAKRTRIDRTGRMYEDFCNLSKADKERVIQGDSVCGFAENEYDCLSLHNVKAGFQLYLYKRHDNPSAVVGWYDHIERLLGSPEEFERCLGIQLVDRGKEFDNFEGMERSCLVSDARRCRVFYCDAMISNQKSEAERNHEQLRRILPKSRTNFDLLCQYDIAECCSHVNSYPLAKFKGKCAFENIGGWLPTELLAELGIERIASEAVVLKPVLMAHAVQL